MQEQNTNQSITGKQYKGQASAEQIQKWKSEHGKIFQYTVEGRTCYLRTVDRDTFALATVKMSNAPSKFNETVIDNIWLGGDDDIRKLDSYYYGLQEYVEELMAKKKGTLSEL